MSLGTKVVKTIFNMSDKARDRGVKSESGILCYKNLRYKSDPERMLWVWHKEDVSSRMPVIVVVHGGGYVYGSPQVYQYYCERLALSGFIVVCFDYGLAPKYIFPTPLIDLNDTLTWMIENVETFPFDIGNVFLVGDSAGAQIASQYAALYSNPDYAEIMEITPPPFKLAGLGLNCGMYDITGDILLSKGFTKTISEAYFTKEALKRFGEKLNVMKYISSRFPPTFLFSANGDFFLNKLEPMFNILQARGVRSESKIYGDKYTAHVFHLNVKSELATKANSDELEFFKKQIIT